MKKKKTHILFTGGGTLGPVIPLTVIADEWKKKEKNVRISWIITPQGPEKTFIEKRKEAFYALATPKLSRHKKWTWPLTPFLFIVSFFKAIFLLKHLQPDMIFSAGGYVSVPVAYAAKILGIPHWIHQLDVRPGLANRFMAPVSPFITTTWEESMRVFSKKKTYCVGGIYAEKEGVKTAKEQRKAWGFKANLPVLLVMGGGTGAKQLNDAMEVIGKDLLAKMQILHITGKGKMTRIIERLNEKEGYVAVEFLTDEMDAAYQLSDMVVSRAGMGSIMALAHYQKPTIILPIEHSHQLDNMEVLTSKEAVISCASCTPQLLKQEIVKLFEDRKKQHELSEKIGKVMTLDGGKEIVRYARAYLSSKKSE